MFYVSRNLVAFYNLRKNSAKPDVSQTFCSASRIFHKIWLRSLLKRVFASQQPKWGLHQFQGRGLHQIHPLDFLRELFAFANWIDCLWLSVPKNKTRFVGSDI